MANITINDETVASSAGASDTILFWDVANGYQRKITKANFMGGVLTGAGTIATGGFTLTVPATGTAALLGTAQTFSALKTFGAGANFGQDTLDYYDIGAWTPVLADASSGGNLATLTTAFGRYGRVGDVCTIWATIDISSVAGMTGGNNMVLRGLPFSSLNFTNYRAYATPRLVNTTFTGIPLAFLSENADIIQFVEQGSAGAGAFLTVSDFGATSDIYLTMTYLVN